ncbi:uncharacterized protein DNG_05064 [Cephalotrichum gorgonifer]|uniref:Uncharacterized protein n=1 Tax=Cephalotrichum gorgonifer TaxID=2041049 RepID=A0AAE8MX62_9PEZI|nr:uncharacterized protein DNG_05064 [Cephalotrichum gorgonifer]
MAAEAPPRYDCVTRSLLEKAKDGINVAAGVHELSAEDRAIINAAELPPAYSLEDKQKIHDVVAKTLAGNESLVAVLQESAAKAVEACKNNEDMFNNIMALLLKVDQENIENEEDAFVPRLTDLRGKYRTIIENSRKLAARIAVYGTNFDEVVVAMCADETLSTDERKNAIAEAIEWAKDFETHSKMIADDLKGAQDDFNTLAVSFSQWASVQGQTIDSDIIEIQKSLDELVERLKKLRDTLIGFGVGEAVGIGLIIGGFWAGPFAPVFTLLAIGFGVGLVATGIQFAACKSEIDQKNAELAALRAKKASIEEARATLVAGAAVDAKEFVTNITSITNIWQAAQTDALKIQEWLKKGADRAARVTGTASSSSGIDTPLTLSVASESVFSSSQSGKPFSQAKVAFAVDISSSTAGRTILVERCFISTISVLIDPQPRSYAAILPWDRTAYPILIVSQVDTLWPKSGTDLRVLLSNQPFREAILRSDLWFLMTDGLMNEHRRYDFAEAIPKTGVHGTSCVIVIFGNPAYDPGACNISVGISIFAVVPNCAFLFCNTNTGELRLFQTRGTFNSLLRGQSPPVFDGSSKWDSLPLLNRSDFVNIRVPPPQNLKADEVALQGSLVINLNDLFGNRLSKEQVSSILADEDNLSTVVMTSRTRNRQDAFQNWVRQQAIVVDDLIYKPRGDMCRAAQSAFEEAYLANMRQFVREIQRNKEAVRGR